MRHTSLSALVASLVPIAWLPANHYPPWVSAWQDGTALALLVAAAMLCRSRSSLSGLWVAAIALAVASITAQWWTGRILFDGDALIALFYVAAFGASLLLGSTIVDGGSGSKSSSGVVALAFVTFACALVSTAIGLGQWVDINFLGVYGVDQEPGRRPFGNLAQQNHFCTVAFLGLCAVALLRETERVGWFGFCCGSALMLAAMVMSGSRTAWLQIGVLLAGVLILRKRANLLVGPWIGVALLIIFVLIWRVWPTLNEGMQLVAVRKDGAIDQLGGREMLWPAMIDAIAREPLLGYGWQQVVLAQQAVALDHPAIQRHFEHTHNFLLDLLVWAGIPVGGAIAVLIATALVRQILATRRPSAAWLMVGVVGVVVHSMLEFPLEYAYFLVPVGLALGAARSMQVPAPLLRFPAASLPVIGAVLGIILTLVSTEYLKAEQNYRIFRLESARIGNTRIETPAPDLYLLTHLGAFLKFAQTEARSDMTEYELEEMRNVSIRFAYPSSMFRYALAAGLNGRMDESRVTLAKLCRVHPKVRCVEAQAAWILLQNQYPVLRDISPS